MTTPVVNNIPPSCGHSLECERIPHPPLTPRAAAPAAACVAGRSTGQHMPPQQALKTNGNSAPHKTKKTKRASILACPAAGRGRVSPAARRRRMSAPERVKESPKPKNKPQPLVPFLLRRHACLTTPVVNPCPRNGAQSNRKRIPQSPPNLLVLPLPRRHAWLAGPPANTCLCNKPSKQTATTPPQNLKPKTSSCRHSVAACVSDHSRGQATFNPRPRKPPQNKRQHPPSSSFRNLPRQRAGTSPAPKKPPSVQTSAPKSQFKPPRRTSPAPSGQNPLPLRRTGEKNIFAQFHPFHPFWRYNMP